MICDIFMAGCGQHPDSNTSHMETIAHMKAATCNSTTEKLHHSNLSHRDTQCIASEMGSCSPHVVCKPWDRTCKAVIQHSEIARISHMIIVYKYTDIIFANHKMHSAEKKQHAAVTVCKNVTLAKSNSK